MARELYSGDLSREKKKPGLKFSDGGDSGEME